MYLLLAQKGKKQQFQKCFFGCQRLNQPVVDPSDFFVFLDSSIIHLYNQTLYVNIHRAFLIKLIKKKKILMILFFCVQGFWEESELWRLYRVQQVTVKKDIKNADTGNLTIYVQQQEGGVALVLPLCCHIVQFYDRLTII